MIFLLIINTCFMQIMLTIKTILYYGVVLTQMEGIELTEIYTTESAKIKNIFPTNKAMKYK